MSIRLNVQMIFKVNKYSEINAYHFPQNQLARYLYPFHFCLLILLLENFFYFITQFNKLLIGLFEHNFTDRKVKKISIEIINAKKLIVQYYLSKTWFNKYL